MNDFLQNLSGGMSSGTWAYYALLLWIGVGFHVYKKIKNRVNQTAKISFKYWIRDIKNWYAVAFAIAFTYLVIRFYNNYDEKLAEYFPEGFKMTPDFAMLIVGYYKHKLSKWIVGINNKNNSK